MAALAEVIVAALRHAGVAPEHVRTEAVLPARGAGEQRWDVVIEGTDATGCVLVVQAEEDTAIPLGIAVSTRLAAPSRAVLIAAVAPLPLLERRRLADELVSADAFDALWVLDEVPPAPLLAFAGPSKG